MIMHTKQQKASGFTLPEAVIAVAVSALGMAGVMSMNSTHLRLVKSLRQSNAASVCLQERVEQLRTTGSDWRNLTNPTFVSGSKLMGQKLSSAAPLDHVEERFTASAYPDPAAA